MVLPHDGARRTPSLPMKPFSKQSRNSRTIARLRSGIVNFRSKARGSTVMRSDCSKSSSNSSFAALSMALQSSSSRPTSKPPPAAVLTVHGLVDAIGDEMAGVDGLTERVAECRRVEAEEA